MDVKTGELTYQLELPKAIYCLKLVEDCYLITAGQGNVITVWDASAFKSERTENVKEKALSNEAISSTPQLEPLRAIHSSHGYSVYALEVIALPIKCDKSQSSSSTASTITLIATGGREILIPLWDLNTGKEMLCVHVPDHIVIHSLAHLALDHSCTACTLPSTNINPPTFANYANYRNTSSEKHKQITTFRLFAGSDNGSIFCWDIVCDSSIENYGAMNSSLTFTLSILKIPISCSTTDRNNESERSERDRDLNENQHDELILEGCQGIFYGHENVVSTLLALLPLSSAAFAPSHTDFKNHTHHRPILVSASKDFSDVRLWLADFTFWPKKRSIGSIGSNSPFICQLTSGHSRPIKSLGLITRHQQSHQTNQNDTNGRVDMSNKGVDDSNIVSHLVTCGSDNKVCVWDVHQILKDLNWERIKWFVLLAKRISLISERRDFRNSGRNSVRNSKSDPDHVESNIALVPLDPLNLLNPLDPLNPMDAHNYLKSREKTEKQEITYETVRNGDIRANLDTLKSDSKLEDGTANDLSVLEMRQLRLILIKIVSRQDILCAVCTFLM